MVVERAEAKLPENFCLDLSDEAEVFKYYVMDSANTCKLRKEESRLPTTVTGYGTYFFQS